MAQYIKRYVPRMDAYIGVELVHGVRDLPRNAVFFCTDDLWEDDERYTTAVYYITGDTDTVWCIDTVHRK